MDLIGVNVYVRMLLGNLRELNGEMLLIEAVTEQGWKINVYGSSATLLHMPHLNTDSAPVSAHTSKDLAESES